MLEPEEQQLLNRQIDLICRIQTKEDIEEISSAFHEFLKKIILNSLNPLLLYSLCSSFLSKLYSLYAN